MAAGHSGVGVEQGGGAGGAGGGVGGEVAHQTEVGFAGLAVGISHNARTQKLPHVRLIECNSKVIYLS